MISIKKNTKSFKETSCQLCLKGLNNPEGTNGIRGEPRQEGYSKHFALSLSLLSIASPSWPSRVGKNKLALALKTATGDAEGKSEANVGKRGWLPG